MKKLKIIRVIIITLIVFIISTIIGVNYLLNGEDILVNFNIISITNEYTTYTLKHEQVNAAKYYKIEIRDEKNYKIYEKETKKTINNFELTNLDYNEEYSLMVYAYSKEGDYRPANKDIKFTWDEATILNENIMLNNKDYLLNIDGALEDKDYHLIIKNNEEEILNEKLKEKQITISKELYLDKQVKLEVNITNNDVIVDEIELFNNINPVSDVKITSPDNEDILPYNDVTLLYEGGKNASSYTLKLYEENKKILEKGIDSNTVVLSSSILEIGKNYQVEIIASYDKYTKSDKVTFTMNEKAQLKPVYISNNWKNITKGTNIELKSHNEDAKIYYTLNGKNPESFGILYTEPIEITEDVTLKAVAVSEQSINSIIKEYEITVRDKTDLKVYLSPSNQTRNLGVSEVGYTNERDEMNDLTDYIEERLKSYGVKVYRNNSSGNIKLWTKDSNYYGVDLHIAIHSNASVDHTAYGVETWIHNEYSKTFSLGSIIQDNLMSIYPYKDKENANRGVKYANGAMGECNDEYLPFGILVEIAHHDDRDDAKWIMENKKIIGYNLADSILEYYQIL